MAEAVISLRQLNITFGTHTVLDNIDLDVYKGETLAVLGPSGTGKSTVLRSMIGLLEPNGGQIFIQGEDVSGLDEDGWNRLRMKMGMVFQYSALFDFLTVGENVAFGLRQHTDKSDEEIQGIVTQMLDLVGLPGTQDLYPAELSGGMKKRVGLARAIAVNPEIVLYDEPTAGLDPIMSRNISRLIKKTQEQLHVTSVLVTHDMQSAFYAADRVAMLYEGHIVAIGTAEEMKNSTNPIVKAFIEGREIKEQVIK
ncbi:MAG TPA: ABC transporter ATP-binding protein [Candidatus Fusicatenibacter intestinipullorum]|jgi:phospholipid/cholesterol/gamma-HCH transport system ATP-binding protein|uniref:ABC transporter ATP-binding protein n=1 Tax=Phascolarctobacterium sp. ET69 TaxID=2939420 RepID=UPI000336715D|nr:MULTISPECIES: ABC transporter ATP-binding protein [Phascolarctobacterium]CDB35551.1 aBC transporter ATP-binding protein [Phascolarctobacterium sp. CAG:266]HJA45053.1 ABC transporter ATP-binding protein [Candidatus Phascolarctobacterium stercoravium]HJA51190.1 ABC transporter ATP-binding protein [Candidatus Fusicatenibacter intestinipullorum]MCL1605580.1 ABC transporter ATP-binding protein [Phascolarctobacterium sp. ET69]MDM8110817.1 ABC transporter ATP-binding protein [Phascolarctobacterium